MDNGTESIRELAAEFRQKADALDELAAKTAAHPDLAHELARILQRPGPNGNIRPTRFKEKKDHPGFIKIREMFERNGNKWMTAREISRTTKVQRVTVYFLLTESPRYKNYFVEERDKVPNRWRLRSGAQSPKSSGPKLSRPQKSDRNRAKEVAGDGDDPQLVIVRDPKKPGKRFVRKPDGTLKQI